MSLMNLLSWSTMANPPTLRLASTRLDEIRLTGASADQPNPRRTNNSPSPAERTGACEAMIDEDAVADAECMKAVALGGEIFLLSRYARVSHQNSFISSRWRGHPLQSRPRLAARWRVAQ
jgi:hypothetical protein